MLGFLCQETQTADRRPTECESDTHVSADLAQDELKGSKASSSSAFILRRERVSLFQTLFAYQLAGYGTLTASPFE